MVEMPACSLFGKLQAKRDFIAVGVPSPVLLPWESWLQAGMAAARNRLEAAFLPHYLEAPLWRFWLGSAICGQAVTGVLMPSMDGVGRHFPLTVMSIAPTGARFPRPSRGEEQQQAWHVAAEDFLLDTLELPEDYDAILQRLATLPACPHEEAREHGLACAGESLLAQSDDAGLRGGLAALEDALAAAALDRMSVFWTIAGADHPARALAQSGLPDPQRFEILLRPAPVTPVTPTEPTAPADAPSPTDADA